MFRIARDRRLVNPAAVLLLAGVGFVGLTYSASAADEKASAPKPAVKPAAKSSPKAAADADKDEVAGAAGSDKVTFAKDVAPLLKESCTRCHGAPQANRGPGGGRGPGGPGAGRGPGGPGGPGMRGPAGGLRLDDRAQVLKGGKHGKAIVPGKAEESLLYKVLKDSVTVGDDEIHAMPKPRPGQDFQPLAEDQVELIKKWIDQGAK